jgi:hypothetical protein
MGQEAARLTELSAATVRLTTPTQATQAGTETDASVLAPLSITDRTTGMSADQDLVGLTISRWRAVAAYRANAGSLTAGQQMAEVSLSLVA